MAPVSTNTLSLSVIAARITASCHSNGIASERTHSRQYAVVSERKCLPTSPAASCSVSSGPRTSVTESSTKNVFSSRIVMTGESLDAPHDHHRTEHAATIAEPRREVGNLDRAARGIGQPRDDDGGVVQVLLLDAGAIEQLDRKAADVVTLSRRGLEQRAKHRVAIEPRETRPGDFGTGTDERADRAVADEGEIERGHEASQLRTARTVGSRHVAAVRPGPTLIE